MSNREWDYIVVGGGSAGSAAVYELAKSGRNKVLLLEAGGSDRSLHIKIYAFVSRAGEKFNWGYISEPDPTRGGRSENWLRGRVLGGSSSINGTIFVRGASSDYDRWASPGNVGFGIRGWGYKDVIPLFEELETYTHGGTGRGSSGRLAVRRVENTHPLTDAFLQAATTAGFEHNPDYNGLTQEGVSYIQLSQRRGLRFSAADAFIRPLRRHWNFKLQLNCFAEKVVFRGKTAIGVQYVEDGTRKTAFGNHVILSAGSINTPKLLMLSGVGAPNHLRELDIPLIVSSPDVGQNLQDHPVARLVYRSRIPSYNPGTRFLHRLSLFTKFLLEREGPIACMFEAVGFLRTSPQLNLPDIQLHFAPLGYQSASENAVSVLDEPSFTILVNKNHPTSRGHVRLSSPSPSEAPVIQPNMLSDPRDLETLARGAELVRSIVRQPALSALTLEEVAPKEELTGNALVEYLRSRTEIAYHPVGTCRMGLDEQSVVDPNLKVRGVENLWIADGSIMPDLPSGNTNAPCLMIGMKLGRELAAAVA